MIITEVFLDMDNVLFATSDYVSQTLGKPIEQISSNEFWEVVSKPGVTSSLPLSDNIHSLILNLKGLNIPLNILSSVGHRTVDNRLALEKMVSIQKHFNHVKFSSIVFVRGATLKQKYAMPGYLLIDDSKDNCDQWRDNGGIAILHSSVLDTLDQLNQLLS
jgi:hypothetical protein